MPIPQIIAAIGMQGLAALQRVVSDNLANASTPGFKKMVVAFGDHGTGPVPHGALDMRQGALEKTGNSLDLALDGGGFFVVRGPHGERLTRGGSFVVNREGLLATRDGAVLLGERGQPIRVGADVEIDGDGVVQSQGVGVGRLRRVDVDASQLVREGGMYRAADGAEVREAATSVKSGFLELANVETVGEMVQMMQTLRSFELLGQVARADDETQQRLMTDVARVR